MNQTFQPNGSSSVFQKKSSIFEMKNILLILFIAMLAGVAGFFMLYKNVAQPAQTSLQKFTVRLGWVNQAQFAGMYIAQDKGFYKQAGLDVSLLQLDKDIDQVKELADGKVDASVMEAHQMLVGVDKGSPVQAVAAIYQINPHVLAARADSNIKTPSDFGGKVIGLAGGVNGEGSALFKIFANRFAGKKQVTFKSLGFNTVDNFINHQADVIDLYRIDQPYMAEKRGVPLTIIPLDAYGFSTYGDVVVTKENLSVSEKVLMKKFVEATINGWEYALKHPEEAVQASLQRADGEYKDVDYQRHILRESEPLIRGNETQLGKMEFVSWSTLYESMRTAGALQNKHDVQTLYTNEFIQ